MKIVRFVKKYELNVCKKSKARAYQSEVLLGRLLALLTNIRLGWRDIPGTNTPAYYEHS
jgi:hypothetical protein